MILFRIIGITTMTVVLSVAPGATSTRITPVPDGPVFSSPKPVREPHTPPSWERLNK